MYSTCIQISSSGSVGQLHLLRISVLQLKERRNSTIAVSAVRGHRLLITARRPCMSASVLTHATVATMPTRNPTASAAHALRAIRGTGRAGVAWPVLDSDGLALSEVHSARPHVPLSPTSLLRSSTQSEKTSMETLVRHMTQPQATPAWPDNALQHGHVYELLYGWQTR